MTRPPRYTDFLLPPYTFVPGRTPHPTRDPRGHDYQGRARRTRTPIWVPPDQWHRSPDYLFGCDLYNLGYWWEAHEAWEALWRFAGHDTAQRRFLQALIQIAVCHLKLEMGVMASVERLLAKANAGLAPLLEHLRRKGNGERYMGLPVRAWLEAVNSYYARTGPGGTAPGIHDMERYPYIVLGGDEAQPGPATEARAS